MKRGYFVLFFLLILVNSSVYAEEKTRWGAQLAFPFYPAIFLDVPISEKSSYRLELVTLWTEAAAVGAKYRRLFGDKVSRPYWEVGTLYVDSGEIYGRPFAAGTVAYINLGTRFSKRDRGGWYGSLLWVVGTNGQLVLPVIGYEFTP